MVHITYYCKANNATNITADTNSLACYLMYQKTFKITNVNHDNSCILCHELICLYTKQTGKNVYSSFIASCTGCQKIIRGIMWYNTLFNIEKIPSQHQAVADGEDITIPLVWRILYGPSLYKYHRG
jgi:hypothetical protein